MSTSETAPGAIGIIGFGEVGQTLAGGLKPSVGAIAAFDILFDDPAQAATMREAAARLGVEAVAEAGDLARDGMLIVSAVTAGSADAVAADAARWVRPGQYFMDVNSISPSGKKSGAALIDAAGGRYVEAAIMSPIHPNGVRSPVLLGGPHAAALAPFLNGVGMNVAIAGQDIGRAAANKLCRSIMVKGMEALVVECLTASRRYGVEDAVLDSLGKTFPGFDWREAGAYMIERVVAHGARRAEEMRFAAETVAAAGIEPLMAKATAARQQSVADTIPKTEAKALKDAGLTVMLDRLANALAEDDGPRE